MENLTLEKRQLCNVQGRLFELALKAGLDCPSSIKSFMNSKTAAALDDAYDRLQWASAGLASILLMLKWQLMI